MVTVDGFTLTGGDYTDLGNPNVPGQYVCRFSFSDCGGGLYVYLSQIHLRNSLIIQNTASQDDGLGGGIIENTTVSQNNATRGGGLAIIEQKSRPLSIRYCTFQDNTATTGPGDGIFVYDADSVNGEAQNTLEDIVIQGNTARYRHMAPETPPWLQPLMVLGDKR